MLAFDTADTFALPADPVAVAGDWHGSVSWVQSVIPAIGRAELRTVLHVGDFGLWSDGFLTTVDFWCKRARVQRVLVTPGNHEDWRHLARFERENDGAAVRVSETVWVLPRPFRFTLGELEVLSMGGAPSVDFEGRTAGFDWFPEELASPEAFARAAAGGRCDVLLAHDCPGGAETPSVLQTLVSNPRGWSASALEYATTGRLRLGELWDAVEPGVTFHGHYHLRDSGRFGERRVESLHMNGHAGNLVVLDPRDARVHGLDIGRSRTLR